MARSQSNNLIATRLEERILGDESAAMPYVCRGVQNLMQRRSRGRCSPFDMELQSKGAPRVLQVTQLYRSRRIVWVDQNAEYVRLGARSRTGRVVCVQRGGASCYTR